MRHQVVPILWAVLLFYDLPSGAIETDLEKPSGFPTLHCLSSLRSKTLPSSESELSTVLFTPGV